MSESGDTSPLALEHPRAYKFGRKAAKLAIRILAPILFVFGAIHFMGFRTAVIVLLPLLFMEVWFYD